MDKKEDSKLTTSEIHKEIDLIQSCIQRMANNSFLLKGWLVSLLAVIMALLPKNVNMFLIIIASLLIVLSFWYLDGFFLRTEKLYRKLYNWVLEERPKGNRENLYNLNSHRFDKEVESVWKVMWSKTLRYFYCIPLLVLVIVTVYCWYKKIL